MALEVTMREVTVLYRWTLHLSCPDREWEAVCGAQDPEMLVDQVPEKPLVGYRLCPRCVAHAHNQS